MLSIDSLDFSYPNRKVFAGLHLEFQTPGIHLIAGETGTGKSTLLEIIAGSTPLFKGGHIQGSIRFQDIDLRDISQRERVRMLGFVGQDPSATFVAQVVFDEIAFGLQFLKLHRREVANLVHDIAAQFKIEDLLFREIDTLSAGQQQRVAIASALVMKPQLLLLDEPTSALDPFMSQELLRILQEIARLNNMFILVSEHRTDRILEYASSVTFLEQSSTVSPIESLSSLSTPSIFLELQEHFGIERCVSTERCKELTGSMMYNSVEHSTAKQLDIAKLKAENVHIEINGQLILSNLNIDFPKGGLTALIGENGAGKTTLIHTLIGDFHPVQGSITLAGISPSKLRGNDVVRTFGIVPSNPQDLFLHQTLRADCEQSDRDRGLILGTTLSSFRNLVPNANIDSHPRDLSSGEQLCLALAIALSSEPEVLLLDEPTRGLDGNTKSKLLHELRRRKQQGTTVVMATHDLELVAEIADHVVLLKDGTVQIQGSTCEVLGAATGYHTLTSEIFSPLPFLTLDDVRRAYQNA